MKKLTFLLAALLFVGSSFAQTQKTKTGDGKTKVKDDKIKVKDSSGTKMKIKAPEQVIRSFTTDNPNITNATWSKNKGDWNVTYKVNGMETVSTYHANGTRAYTRTTYPVDQAPQAVMTYRQNNPSLQLQRIVLINTPEKSDVYELTNSTGQVTYIDGSGTVVTYTPGH
jgi:hypothetical protein